MRRAIVTGAEGFLGRRLVHELRQHHVEVLGLTRYASGKPGFVAVGEAPWSRDRLTRIIQAAAPDVIFHLAGGSIGSEQQLQELNVGLARSVMQAIRDLRIYPLLVCCGSAAEYGRAFIDGVPIDEGAVCLPAGAYGATKLTQTHEALAFSQATGVPVLVVRIFNAIGAGMPPYLALGDFARQIAMLPMTGGILETGDLHTYRDFIDIDHVALLLRTLAGNVDARGIVNICSGEATELRRLVDLLIEASGRRVTLRTNPSRIRPNDPKFVIGSTARLMALGAAPPRTDYAHAVGRLWEDIQSQMALSS